MNEHMRRYLSEDWNPDDELAEHERDPRPPKRALAQTRRQQEKQRGKVIAKHVRAIMQQRKNGKP